MSYQQFKQDYQGKKVLIMGLGLQGGGVGDANFFTQIGCQVTATDLKSAEELTPSLKRLDSSVKLVLGRHENQDFQTPDLIIKNPAVVPESPYLKIARQAKVPISLSTSLFAAYCPAKMIGITGTRGKSTTAQLIFNICRRAGKKVKLGGNVRGVATLPLLKGLTLSHWMVLELSSWELAGFHQQKISPQVAIFTNIYPDHLNRYHSMNDYIFDKTAIFKYQAKENYLIINQDNAETQQLAEQAKSRVIYFSQVDWLPEWPLKLLGQHNRANAAAALRAALILGLDQDLIKYTIGQFSGLAYRLESRATVAGVEFINDTTSTTPIAGEKALQAINKPVVLLAGGASKKLPLAAFAKMIRQKAKAVVLLDGSATDELARLIKKFGGRQKIAGRFANFSQAMETAYELASPGEAVLLSPGCASFGMFKNEFDRGDQFNHIVEQLAHEEKV
ncbi:UDP-N-acetylmuramoyl-L-alanine--D-glutamate ligase [Patescibacteria group bacterium]|nr:UDP-N-acetylmuramoyl-L-alanine--D-glutamate ligase [Patescibacteria group bacterium]MBU1931751.1 UDP-N-acetylmuramoyl-L-alanine--D-glutamate ligase [Patescibacteria group bacterium]